MIVQRSSVARLVSSGGCVRRGLRRSPRRATVTSGATATAPPRYDIVVLCLGLVVALGGCRHPPPAERQGPGSVTGAASTQMVTGTVRYLDVEGGFYGIVTDDGRKLDPVNLPPEFQKDGLRLRARVEPLQDRITIRMWGTPVRIVEFQRL